MINDHGLDAFKIIPDWFQNQTPPERRESNAGWNWVAPAGTD